MLQKKVILAQMDKVEAEVEASKEGEVEVEEEEAIPTQEEEVEAMVTRGMLNVTTATSMGIMRGSVEQNKLQMVMEKWQIMERKKSMVKLSFFPWRRQPIWLKQNKRRLGCWTLDVQTI